MGKANSHGWDDAANFALLEAMNLRFRPNAEDCKELSVQLGVRGFKFSAGATLYASSPLPLFTFKLLTLTCLLVRSRSCFEHFISSCASARISTGQHRHASNTPEVGP